MKKSIGIIGGMGPLATCDLMEKIINATDAIVDQDYPHIYVDCNTDIKDRTNFILNNMDNPLDELIKTAQKLEKQGAEVLCMPCNTAHYFYEDIQKQINVHLINMIESTVLYIKNKNYRKAALLATDGTLKSSLYTKYALKYDVDILIPSTEDQKLVMDLIYKGVKASNWAFNIIPFVNMLTKMEDEGVEVFILGCTELPIAFKYFNIGKKIIDPTAILAIEALKQADYKIK